MSNNKSASLQSCSEAGSVAVESIADMAIVLLETEGDLTVFESELRAMASALPDLKDVFDVMADRATGIAERMAVCREFAVK